MTPYIKVGTTVGNEDDARKIAKELVKRRLAACVQIEGPVSSTYWWEGKVEETCEWQCTAKTRKDLFGNLEKTILEIHPYQVPEILALPLVAGSNAYFKWIDEELGWNPEI
jgi:periplasmic divalent cation tolerance protein